MRRLRKVKNYHPINLSCKFIIYFRDVNDPLIDNKFFTDLDKEKRRVERQIRKDRITLGQNRISQLAARRTVNF